MEGMYSGSSQTTNEDLIWDLNQLHQRTRAKQFALQFEKTLCVFSGPVRQLYTNFNIYMPQDVDHRLVILPNPNAYHDTFNCLPEDSAIGTGICIIPGDSVGKEGLYIRIPFNHGQSVKTVPIAIGLNALLKLKGKSGPFLPVLAKGDLREMDHKYPCLHLHRIRTNKLTHLSDMEKKSIEKAIIEKLQPYLKSEVRH